MEATPLQTVKAASMAAAISAACLAACTDEQLGPPTEDDSARFMGQAGLAATTAECAELMQLGYSGWLDKQFALPLSESLWDWMVLKGFGDAKYKSTDVGMDNALWYRLINAQDVLRQRVVLALSEIFVISLRNMPVPWGPFLCVAYWEMLEAHCFGNFRSLLESVSLSPAMGVYLSMRGSQKEDSTGRRPDENFARELMQLFSIGLVQLNLDGTPKLNEQGQTIDTYGIDDVRGLAGVFTGWDFDAFDAASPGYARRPMVFSASTHSTLDKSFLGTTITGSTPGEQAFKQALDTVFMHPNVGPFIAMRLIQRLVTSNPSGDYVARVARVFNDNGQGVRGDMQAVIRAILLDGEARLGLTTLPTDRVGKLREPILRFLQWARVARLGSVDGLWNVGDLSGPDRLGQSPLRAPSVFNFFRPGYVPRQTQVAHDGLVAPEFQITDESTVIGYANFMFWMLPGGASNVSVDYSDWTPLASDPVVLVDKVNQLFTGRSLSASLVADLGRALGSLSLSQQDGAKRRVITAMLTVLCSPEFLVQGCGGTTA